MRPYLAVIVDSFRAAMSSWVLYIMLILITGILLAMAPIGYEEELTTGLDAAELIDPYSLMERLQSAGADEKPSLEKSVWQRLDEPLRKEIVALPDKLLKASRSESEADRAIREAQVLIVRLARKLDAMLDEEDFFDETLWSKVELDPEAGELIAKGLSELPADDWTAAAKEADTATSTDSVEARLDFSEITYDQWRKLAWKAETKAKLLEKAKGRLSHEELGRLNRLALDAAFPGMISASTRTSMRFYWAAFAGSSIQMRRQELADRLSLSLPSIVDNFILSIGMIVAIVVTAPIVPQMFEPGSLNLLLSKPVTRWMLFLAKFVGGCAFTLLCAAYLFGGAWLLLGLRLGIWHPGILVSIPIYVFVFAIYFTVSAIAGVIWRNSIVSVIVTVLFWGMCWIVGISETALGGFNSLYHIVNLAPAGDGLPLYVDPWQRVYSWSKRDGSWQEALIDPAAQNRQIEFGSKLLGPIYDDERKQFAVVRVDPRRRGVLIVAREEEDWAPRQVSETPMLTEHLLREPNGDLLTLNLLGELDRVAGDPLAIQRRIELAGESGGKSDGKSEDKAAPASDTPSDSGATAEGASDENASDKSNDAENIEAAAEAARVALAERMNVFTSAGPKDPIVPQPPFAVAMHPTKRLLATYSRGVISLYAADEAGIYALAKKGKKLKGNETLPATLAFAGETLVVARGDGKVLLVDAGTLRVSKELAPSAEGVPLEVAASPDGTRAAVLFQDNTLYTIDVAAAEIAKADVEAQGKITAIAFGERGRLWVASREQRVTEYLAGQEFQADRRLDPPYDFQQNLYHYLIRPLYVVFPKPGQFDQTVQYLLLDNDSGETATGASSRAIRATLDPWSPVLSGAAFMVVMLGLACLYIERQDF